MILLRPSTRKNRAFSPIDLSQMSRRNETLSLRDLQTAPEPVSINPYAPTLSTTQEYTHLTGVSVDWFRMIVTQIWLRSVAIHYSLYGRYLLPLWTI